MDIAVLTIDTVVPIMADTVVPTIDTVDHMGIQVMEGIMDMGVHTLIIDR